MRNVAAHKQLELKKTDLQMQTCFLWLELKNLFQTFGTQDEVEIEQEIKEIRALFSNANEEDLRRLRDEGTADEAIVKKGT